MITKIIPQLPSMNLERSLKFYESKLEFSLKRKYPDILLLEKDGLELHLWLCDNPEIPRNSSAYFHVVGIEEWYEYCERKGVVHPNAHLEDKPWGMKEFYAVDPDNNLLKFGQFSMTSHQ